MDFNISFNTSTKTTLKGIKLVLESYGFDGNLGNDNYSDISFEYKEYRHIPVKFSVNLNKVDELYLVNYNLNYTSPRNNVTTFLYTFGFTFTAIISFLMLYYQPKALLTYAFILGAPLFIYGLGKKPELLYRRVLQEPNLENIGFEIAHKLAGKIISYK